MGDANDEMWERFLAFPDMGQDSSAEWSEGQSAALGGGCGDRATGSLPEIMQRHGRLSIPTASSTQCYLTSPFMRGA